MSPSSTLVSSRWVEHTETKDLLFVEAQTKPRKKSCFFAQAQRRNPAIQYYGSGPEIVMPPNVMGKIKISREMTMDHIMSRSPDIIPFLLKNRMHCVGCLLTQFHTLADAAFEHEIDEDLLIAQLRAVGITITK